MAKITVDGIDLDVPEGTVLLEACRQAGIEIPHFCYYAKLTLIGACRMCLVEIEKMPKPQTSCTVLVRDGMVVHTNTPAVQKMRRAVLEFLLLNHSLTCPTCDAGGECELQDNVFRYRDGESRMEEAKQRRGVVSLGPFIDKNMERCVQCYRCTRYCDEVMGVTALAMVNRGAQMEVASFNDKPLDCVLCGNCVEVCPVGALTSNLFDYKRRPWEREETRCVCPYCGDGCSMLLETKDNRIFRTRAFLESGILRSEYHGVNDEFLCVKGRFGYQFLQHPERLTTPLVRRGDELRPASWDEALGAVAEGLGKGKAVSPNAVGFVGSQRCTNEAAYLFQKLARAVIGTNNVDCRVGYKRPSRPLPPGASTPSLREIRTTPGVLVIGANPSDENPLTETEIRMSVRRNAGILAVADPRRSLIVEDAAHFLRCRPGTEAVIALGIARALLDEKGLDIPSALSECLQPWSLQAVEQATGVSEADVRAVARDLFSVPHTLMLYGTGLLSAPGGDSAAQALHVLAGALEWPEPLFLAPFNNTRGAYDMGLLPDMLPGYRPVEDTAARSVLAELWGASPPSKPGLDVRGMLQTAAAGEMSALYIMGANPAASFPDGALVKEALRRVPFLVVQDIFLSETAKHADVVLPACAFAEQEGTYTNIEGRVQRCFSALEPPGEARADAVILAQVAQKMGASWSVLRPEIILDEIARASGIYAGITAERLAQDGVVWTREAQSFPRAHLGAVPTVRMPSVQPPAEYPLVLITGQLLFHSGTLSTWAEGLRLAAPSAVVQINPEDARQIGVSDGDVVTVESRCGRLQLPAKITDVLPPGVVFVPVNFPETPVNGLMHADAPIDYVRVRKELGR